MIAFSLGRDLPPPGFGKPLVEPAQTVLDRGVTQLAFHQQNGLQPLYHHKVDLVAIAITEIAQVEVASLGVLLVVDPFQKMAGHQVLEARAR